MRPGEELDTAALSRYLGKAVTAEQFPAGHSNLTYLITTTEGEYVLRRPPLGPVAPKAHDMAREYAILAAVHPHFPEAPQVYQLCEDPSILGAPFFLMERRHGIILRDEVPASLDQPRSISAAFVDCLVRLHAIDIADTGLVSLGKPDGFLDRQVSGWSGRWNRAQTQPVPDIEAVIAWLGRHIPPPCTPALVHNDYKLDNVMFASPQKVEAVLDWEMTTVGDPLADLGLTLCYWASELTPVTSKPDWYTRDELIERYAERTGRDLTHIRWYEVLGIFKLAVILQQIYYRFHHGQTRDERFRDFDLRVAGLARTAYRRGISSPP